MIELQYRKKYEIDALKLIKCNDAFSTEKHQCIVSNKVHREPPFFFFVLTFVGKKIKW